jgi:hypothetical protein
LVRKITISADSKDMQHPILPKRWHLLRAILNVVGFLFVFVWTQQTSFAIYVAIATKGSITFEGNGSLVDSFNSADPSKSTNGQYDPALAGDDGLIISSGLAPISIGNSDIYGRVLFTGAEGTVDLGPEGGIGTHSWLSTNTGIEPGYVASGAAFNYYPAVTLPYTTGIAPAGGTNIIVVTAGTNIVVTNSPTPPPSPGPNQTIVCTTNNSYYFTNSVYPGPVPGLTTNTIVTVAATNTIVTEITNCSSTIVLSPTNPPAGSYCPGTLPWSTNISPHGPPRWAYYPFIGYTYFTNSIFTYSTNYSYSWQGIAYNYQINQAPIYQTNAYNHILSGGNYCAGDIFGTTLVTGPSTLVLTNGLNLTAHDSVTISPTGSLVIYVDGGSVINSAGGFVNNSGLDLDLQIYCTAGVASLSLNQPAPFSGVIIAPDTDVSIGSYGSASALEYSGAIIANSLIAQALHMHGDEALNFPTPPSIVASVSPSPPAPITDGPQSPVVVLAGSQVTLQILQGYLVLLGPTATFQWYFNGTNLITNETNSFLTLSNVSTDMAGAYSVEASSLAGPLMTQPQLLSVLTSPAATLDTFSISTTSQFQMNVTGLSGYFYRVEASSNLSDWTPFLTDISPFIFTDTNQLGLQYFYRAVYVPTP